MISGWRLFFVWWCRWCGRKYRENLQSEVNSRRIKVFVMIWTFKLRVKVNLFLAINGYDEKTGEFRLLQQDPVEIKKDLWFQQV